MAKRRWEERAGHHGEGVADEGRKGPNSQPSGGD